LKKPTSFSLILCYVTIQPTMEVPQTINYLPTYKHLTRFGENEQKFKISFFACVECIFFQPTNQPKQTLISRSEAR